MRGRVVQLEMESLDLKQEMIDNRHGVFNLRYVNAPWLVNERPAPGDFV